jgi:transcriptional regulator
MYIPKFFEETDSGVLHSLIRSHPLGAWVTSVEGKLVVNHIPFLVDSTQGQHGMLVGHVARANPIWQSLAGTAVDSVVIFQGPQCYITPSWYASKREHGEVVPTWNYAVVHAHGAPRVVEDRDWLLKHVTQLSEHHESEREVPWSVSDAPRDFIDSLLKSIVGIEIPITRIEGKWKTSQNRSLPDKLGTIAGLHERGDGNSKQMAVLVQKHTPEAD